MYALSTDTRLTFDIQSFTSCAHFNEGYLQFLALSAKRQLVQASRHSKISLGSLLTLPAITTSGTELGKHVDMNLARGITHVKFFDFTVQ